MPTRILTALTASTVAFCSTAYAADPPGPSSDGYEWRTGDKDGNSAPIEVNIWHPSDAEKSGNPPAHYTPINQIVDMFASASDTDSYCLPADEGGDGIWYNYSDDVRSGFSAADHHLLWTISSGGGEFVDSNRYGFLASYRAPDYSHGNNLRTVRVKVEADDYQRAGDNLGDPNDSGKDDSIELKIWQVTVSFRQSGTNSPNNNVQAPIHTGGANLGWVTPGTPPGNTGYNGNTEIKGTIPAGPGVVTGYYWVNEKKGFTRRKVNGGDWVNVLGSTVWTGDSPHHLFQDRDSRHGGVDVREIFMVDSPGFEAGASNDFGIDQGWTDVERDMNFRAHVKLGDTRISNKQVWPVKMVLEVANGKWSVISHTP